ncbi:UH1BL-like protein [Mya arenaria]|uniref:UH1BL-like protein n=1 Tax=Mya arenaria TaxID=6604 RepID=A0ABY7DZM7_MYAAR|nr:bridge-like lipid transfer protein family member 3B isoform X2 [Mya arenaria]WAR03200.1 UH1BL-like protein [Mya arenaria]
MASLLKNQILKHLSKFTKNLSPDRLNISTLKGEGELTNLELDENILMNLMDLPTWMRLNKAVCNKVSIKIQWTKLKSQPICLYLDEVVLEIETCSEPRAPSNPTQQSTHSSEGRYGFADKVIDGIYVHINSVSVRFMSDKFHASLQLSRVKVQSLTPNWVQPTDIRQTRIRSEATDEIILFKEVDWQTTRIEANAHEDETSLPSTPLRLIANQSKIRIVLKKKLSDCSVISSRILLLLDDLLWVLTDTQLKAAIVYANSLSGIIEKSAEQSKRLAAEKLQKQGKSSSSSDMDQFLLQQQHQQRQRGQTTEAQLFQKFDVLTTSYHLITSRIDLHLCDDNPTDRASSPKHNKKIDGGAMQVTFCKLSLDYYPFHYAGGERKNWYRYSDNLGSRNTWVQGLFAQFRGEAKKARETCKIVSPSPSPAHNLKSPSHPVSSPVTQGSAPRGQPRSQATSPQSQTRGQTQLTKGQAPPRPRVTKLLESCMVLKIEDFTVYMVSTADNKRTPQKFFSSDKKALHLPSDMSTVHIEYTEYFFTEGIDYPVPHANIYVLVNPVRLHIDFLTLLWANYFSLNLAQMVESHQGEFEKKLEHVDVKLEALMPRVVISVEERVENQPDRPGSLQIQISKLTASNTHIEDRFTLPDLKAMLNNYADCSLFDTSQVPNDHPNKMMAIPKIFYDFANARLNPYLCDYALDLVQGRLPDGFDHIEQVDEAIKLLLRTNTLKRDMRCDMWAVCLDQVWLEFLGVPTSRTRPVPFVESFPLTLWVCQPSLIPDGLLLPKNKWPSSNKDGVPEESKTDRDSRRSRKLLQQYYSEDSGEDSSPTDSSSEGGMTTSQSISSCDNSDGNVQYSAFQVADFNIVAKIGGKVRAQLSNPQYLFLMRLIDSVTDFNAQLNADMGDYMKKDASENTSESFSIPLVIPEVEFAMVCPYIAELLPLTNIGEPVDGMEYSGEVNEDLPGYTEGYSMEYTQGYVERGSGTSEGEQGNQVDSIQDYGAAMHVSVSSPITPEVHLSHSQSDSTIVCFNQATDNLQVVHKDSHSTEDVHQGGALNTAPPIHVTASDTGLSSIGSSLAGPRGRAGSKITSNAVKKSFTVGVSNISNFMGKIKNKLDPEDDIDSDRISVMTDMSSDDDFEFLSIDDQEAPAFNHGRGADTLSTTDTDDQSSVFAESTSASKAKELVSAVVFRLTGSELSIQGKGEDIFFSLQTRCIDVEETGNIIYEDFYSKLSATSGIIRRPAVSRRHVYPVQFKMTMGPAAGLLVPRGAELGLMEVKARDYELTFCMSSILNMSSFIEDEKISTPTPMQVSVHNLKLTLVEDRPPHKTVPPPSPPPPTVVSLQDIFIARHEDGIFHITTGPHSETPSPGTSMSDTILAVSNRIDTNMQQPHTTYNLPNGPNQTSPDSVSKIMKLENENAQMKLLLEKLDNHTQVQERELEDIKSENEQLRNKLRSFALSSSPSLDDIADLRKVNEGLEKDNGDMCERLVTLEEEVRDLRLEKQSLVSTLQLMQDELIVSEHHRHRSSTGGE